MANAIHSKKTKLEINTTGDTWVQIKGLKSFSGIGGGSPAVIDSTDLDSEAKEKLMGLKDEGQASFTFNYIPSDAGQIALQAARDVGDVASLRVTLNTNNRYEFDGYVMTAEVAGGVDELLALTSNVEVTGAVTKVTVTP
jgi:hypothetical protein